MAGAFLRRQGYRVLFRNFLTPDGEIDLVCRSGDVLAFVEVRTRARLDFGRPVESIDSRKEEALRAAAESYLQLLDNRNILYRFDAVEVMLQAGEVPQCALQKNIFT